MQPIRERIADTILKSLRLTQPPASLEGLNLLREVGISSVDALEILIGIEVEFGVEIPDEDLRSDLLESLDVLEAYVRRRLAAEPPSATQ
ncbi:phosphopantetheine-binding protein [Blastochloris viridis]|uniref:Acyl carrier protein AcpP n=1 Tax=Blastochloris viridis TaxID=1079 RepID=A0A0H5B8R1_BLAVI|nr:acyl carrier protein [Blastochloris viridis]ALK08132.1 Acyl carrier protein [Blastochloris viridis]BAR98602.1 hypothetical protein BV133_1009 [Blastochloris viridis]CUU44054.1 Acyl carrier protein AcpP [Blastochloris viridis]